MVKGGNIRLMSKDEQLRVERKVPCTKMSSGLPRKVRKKIQVAAEGIKCSDF